MSNSRWGPLVGSTAVLCLAACTVEEAPLAPEPAHAASRSALDDCPSPPCEPPNLPEDECDRDPTACVPPPPSYPTYEKDVRVLLEARCADCHRPGGVGYGWLDATDYDDVWARRAWWSDALDAPTHINDPYMPPWSADPGCRDYDGDRSMDPSWVSQLQGWVQHWATCGEPCKAQARGDSRHAPSSAPYVVSTDYAFDSSAPSVQATPSPATQVSFTSATDRYVCRAFPYAQWADAQQYPNGLYITGMKVLPDDPDVVHHVLNYAVSPANVQAFMTAQDIGAAEMDQGAQFDCYSLDFESTDLLGGWVPGGQGGRFPAGSGVQVASGSYLIMQVHYHGTSGTLASDATGVRFSVANSVAQPGRLLAFTNPGWTRTGGMLIPPGATTHRHGMRAGLLNGGRGFYLWGATFHMHNLGSGGKLWLEHSIRNGGGDSCLVDIPDPYWRFDWQRTYWFEANSPQYVRPTDQLNIECRWDNQTGQTVEWGEGSNDEMCVAYMFMTDALP